MPGAKEGLQPEDPTLAELLKPLGYTCGQFGKNHLGDLDEFLPTVHGFDEFFGNLYHLNAEEEPELPDYPKNPEFKKKFGPRGVLKSKADGKGGRFFPVRSRPLLELLAYLRANEFKNFRILLANFRQVLQNAEPEGIEQSFKGA